MHTRIRHIEQNVGKFSDYAFYTSKGLMKGCYIPPQQRLAFQLLRPLGCKEEINNETIYTNTGVPLQLNLDSDNAIYPNIDIYSLTSRQEKFTITGKRINELLKSSKVYINTDLLSEEDYFACLNNTIEFRKSYQAHKRYQPKINDVNNLSPAICHAQKIDLLVTQHVENGNAISNGKSGQSSAHDSAIILLTTPALDFRRNDLKSDSSETMMIIKGMYRNLFRAAMDNNCRCIALPAAGLGEFRGEADVYFNCLKEVAMEFPNLYIIYNPRDKYIPNFDNCFANNVAPNVIRTDRDILFIADELIKQGIGCAVNNPSTKDAVFGSVDIGNKWRYTNPSAYAAEEHIAAKSTAFINSRTLNPFPFANPIVYKFFEQHSPLYEQPYQQNYSNHTQSSQQLFYDNNNYLDQQQQYQQQQYQQQQYQQQQYQQQQYQQQQYQQQQYQQQQYQQQQYQQQQYQQQQYQQQCQQQQYQQQQYQQQQYQQQQYQQQCQQQYEQQLYEQQQMQICQSSTIYIDNYTNTSTTTNTIPSAMITNTTETSQQSHAYHSQRSYQHQPQFFTPIQTKLMNSVQQQPQYEWGKLFNYPTKTKGLSVSLAEKIRNFLQLDYLPYLEKKKNGFYFGFNNQQHRDVVMHMLSEFSFDNLQFVSFQEAKQGNISSAKSTFFATLLNSNTNDRYNFGVFIPHDETNTNKEKMGLLFATAFLPSLNITADKIKKWQAMYETMSAFGEYGASHSMNSSMLMSFKRLF